MHKNSLKHRQYRFSMSAVLTICLLLFFCLPLVACDMGVGDDGKATSSTDDLTGRVDEQTIVLGFSQLGSESAWRVGSTVSIQQAAESAGIQLMFENAQQKQENQIKAIRSFIAYQVDVLLFRRLLKTAGTMFCLRPKRPVYQFCWLIVILIHMMSRYLPGWLAPILLRRGAEPDISLLITTMGNMNRLNYRLIIRFV
jgi:hypothetical protein